MFSIKVNNQEIRLEQRKTILEAALENGIYIPHLCHYPGVGNSSNLEACKAIYRDGQEIVNDKTGHKVRDCHLCVVEVKGVDGFVHACSTSIVNGMEVYTDTVSVREKRREHLEEILKNHPHACLACNLSEGCDRKICSMDVPEEARCCWKFGNCEFQKVASFVGFNKSIPFSYKNLPVFDDNPLFIRDYNLCISCLRCVLACREVAGRNAIGFVFQKGQILVGSTAPTLKGSGCKFCLACVEVCPTGALRDKNQGKKKSKIRREIPPVILPPEEELEELMILKREVVEKVPEVEGVYRLWDEKKELYQITGTDNIKASLRKELEDKCETYYFDYEEDMMYTSRESQLIQQYLKKFGRLPPGNGEDDELF